MAKPSHIPKFGNWDPSDHTPYTVVFDNARAGKGKIINPNDPMENESLFEKRSDVSGGNSGASVESAPRPAARHQRRASRDDSEYVFNSRHGQSSSRGDEDSFFKTENGSKHERGSNGSGLSPLQPQAYGGGIGRKPSSSSTALDRKSDEGAPGYQIKNQQPERHASHLPKFGEWDVNNPSGDGYTVIFEKARVEKKAGEPFHVHESSHRPRSGQDAPKTQPTSHERSNWLCRCFHPNTA